MKDQSSKVGTKGRFQIGKEDNMSTVNRLLQFQMTLPKLSLLREFFLERRKNIVYMKGRSRLLLFKVALVNTLPPRRFVFERKWKI
jgi:hypothetical protein